MGWDDLPEDVEPLGGGITTAWFLLEVDGVEIGSFRTVRGLQLSVEVEQYAEGGENGFVHKFPGRLTWPNLVFSRGLVSSDALFTWVAASGGEGFASNGNSVRRSTGAVSALDHEGNRLRSWEFDRVFAVSWTGPDLDVGREDELIEQLEVAHHGFRAKTRQG
ncbi:MAG: phage tail protein [Kineosporiaceae bacterium]